MSVGAPRVKAREWVTIVAGLPRSGTSMMMQILEAGGLSVLTDRIREADEDNPRGYYEFEAVKQTAEDASWLEQAPGKVVKMVYRLLYTLPADRSYRVVFTHRQLEEVIASQDEMLRRHGTPTGELKERQLADIYRRQLSDVEKWLATQPNFSVLYVDYHDLLADPATVIEEINGFLGGDLDTEAMLQVPDKRLYRQRR
jgi:hypothetical protein